jgi:MFS family permease
MANRKQRNIFFILNATTCLTNSGTELIGLSTKDISLLMALFAIFNGIGRPIFGWITDKFSTQNAMYLSYGLIISSAILILFANEGDVLLYLISLNIFFDILV